MFRLAANSALSAMLRYVFSWYFFSNLLNCWVVNGVLGFLSDLCFLKVHLRGRKGGDGEEVAEEERRLRRKAGM